MASGNATNAQFYASLRCQFNFFSFSLGEIDGPLKKYYTIFFFQKSDMLLYLKYFLHHNRTQKLCLLILVSRDRSCHLRTFLSNCPQEGNSSRSQVLRVFHSSEDRPSQRSCMSALRLSEPGLMKGNSPDVLAQMFLWARQSPHGTRKNHLCAYKNDDLPKESLVTILYKSNGDVCVFSSLPCPVVESLRCFPNKMAETLILIDVSNRGIWLTTGYKALEPVEFCCCFCFVCCLLFDQYTMAWAMFFLWALHFSSFLRTLTLNSALTHQRRKMATTSSTIASLVNARRLGDRTFHLHLP